MRLSRLSVTDGHELQLYDVGGEDAKPVLFLHGGPGSGVNEERLVLLAMLTGRRFISFDQRGCGKSTPAGAFEHNTTDKLIEDIEAIRELFAIQSWPVFGSSWGTTLALAYAKAQRDKVEKLVLISLFLGRREDQDWSLEGVSSFFPDAYEKLCKDVPTEMRIQDFLYDALCSGDEERMRDAAWRFDSFGNMICRLEGEGYSREQVDEASIVRAKILLHYAQKDFFFDKPEIGVLDGIEALKDLPISILHGRFDMDCRPEQAYLLTKILPQVSLRFALGSHSWSEEPFKTVAREFIKAELS